jgi:hypothetical protein
MRYRVLITWMDGQEQSIDGWTVVYNHAGTFLDMLTITGEHNCIPLRNVKILRVIQIDGTGNAIPMRTRTS